MGYIMFPSGLLRSCWSTAGHECRRDRIAHPKTMKCDHLANSRRETWEMTRFSTEAASRKSAPLERPAKRACGRTKRTSFDWPVPRIGWLPQAETAARAQRVSDHWSHSPRGTPQVPRANSPRSSAQHAAGREADVEAPAVDGVLPFPPPGHVPTGLVVEVPADLGDAVGKGQGHAVVGPPVGRQTTGSHRRYLAPPA